MKHGRLASGWALAAVVLSLAVAAAALLRDDAPRIGNSRDRADGRSESLPAAEPAPLGMEAAPAEDDDLEFAAPSRDVLVDHVGRQDGPTLIVEEKESGRPRPDAGVRLVRRDAVTDEEWNGLLVHDPEVDELIEQRGSDVELDALATAALPWDASEALACADVDDRHGRRRVRLDSGERVVLRLVRREKLTIVAVDPDGRPQRDVPVSLQSVRRGEPARGEPWSGRARLLWKQATDRDGEASVAHGSELLDEHLDADGLATVAVVVAALAFPCRDPSPMLVDPRKGCEGFVHVVTPPRATLRLRAESDDPRKPFGAEVEVRAVVPGKPPSGVPVEREWTATIPAGGEAELTVEADVPVELEASTRDGRFEEEKIAVTAPGRAESLDVTLLLRPKPGPPCCTVKVVDPGGAPVASVELLWQTDAAREFHLDEVSPAPDRFDRATTDANGELRLATAPLAAFVARLAENAKSDRERRRSGGAEVGRLVVFVEADSPRPGGARFAGAVALPALQPTDEADLGTITLVEIPVLLAGRVVDPEDRGVGEATVRITDAREKPKSWTAVTDASGRFLVHAHGSSPWLEVWPSLDRWYRAGEFGADGKPVALREPLGASDVEITLHRTGWARGRLLVDPGISLHGLFIVTLPEPAPDVRSQLAADGRFLVYGSPGRRTLIVRSLLGMPPARREPPEPIAEIGDFVLEEAKESADPRLDPVDLRRELRQVELEVTGVDRTPVSRAVMQIAFRNGRLLPVDRSTDPFGRAIVTTPEFDAWLILGSPDHRFQAIRFEPPFQPIELAPATIVRVRVEGPANELLASKRFVPTLALTRASGGTAFARVWETLDRPRARRRDATTFEIPATMAGEYALWWKRRPEDRNRDALWGPKSVTVGSRDAFVDVTEKLSEQDVGRIRARLDR